jgi:Holliday junction DNA helicase RuvA
MIGYLCGKVKFIEEDSVILDVSGIGFKIFCSKKTLTEVSPLKVAEFFIHFHRNQTALGLFGFLTKEEKDFFEILIDVSGIGPKAALVVTSIGPPEKLKKAIMAGDESFFEKVPGIGKKRIQKIILELAGKINKETNVLSCAKKGKIEDEAFEALIKLGFNKTRAKEALLSVSSEIKTSEERIREALKILGSSK